MTARTLSEAVLLDKVTASNNCKQKYPAFEKFFEYHRGSDSFLAIFKVPQSNIGYKTQSDDWLFFFEF